MNIYTVLFAFSLLLCRARAQYCGCGDPLVYPTILPTSVLPPPLISTPQVLPTPAIGTTIIDNSLSTALANVLQLLIVSDLIESTLNTALGLRGVPLANPICEPVIPQPVLYAPTKDVIAPVVECIPPPCGPVVDIIPQCGPVFEYIPPCGQVYDFVPQCAPVVDFFPPCGPVYDFVPQCAPIVDFFPPCGQTYDFVPQCAPKLDFFPPCGQVYDFVPQCGPVIEFTPPSPPVYDFVPTCGQYIEPLPNFYGDCLSPLNNLQTYPSPNYCGMYEYISPAPMYTQAAKQNQIGLQDIGPVQMAPVVPNCYNGLTEVIRPNCNMGPLAEILFPSAIPAQLTCNIGAIPASLPCVSVNVEPLPYGSNAIGNPYFY